MNKIILEEGNSKIFEAEVTKDMQAVLDHYIKELSALRTGRASTKLVEDITAECYGQDMRIKELAAISAPEARLITIQPWDKANIVPISKALIESDLGLNPMNDGDIIRIQLPMMTEERRKKLIKILGKTTEDSKIAIRNVRKEYHNALRDAEKEGKISEDFAERIYHHLQDITDKFIAKISELNDKKEKDILYI